MHKKQRGKNEESNAESNKNINSNIKTFPIKIKILLAYLEKILYLCGIFFAVKKMNDLRLSVYAVVRAHSKTEY